MKVLITGVAGNLGKVLARYLTSRHINVIGFDTLEQVDSISHPKFKYYRCSITNEEKMSRIFKDEQPTNVIHLACTFNRVRNRNKEMKIDVGGSKIVLKIADKTPSVKQLIYSSSAAAYGGHQDNDFWLDENHPLRPGNYSYGIIKKMVEELYFRSYTRLDLNIVSLRICSVVGPSFNKKRCAVSILINSSYLLDQWKENRVQFLHEDDLNQLVLKILTDDGIQGTYNLAPDSFSQVNKLVPDTKFVKLPTSIIQGLLWLLYNSRVVNLRPSSFKQSVYPIVLSPAKLISRYNYRFKYNSEQAFFDTLRHYKLRQLDMAAT